MKTESVVKLVWLPIYGGMALGMLGLWIGGGDGPIGPGLAVLGGLLIAGGLYGIWWRSRWAEGEGEGEGERPRRGRSQGDPGAPR